MTTYSLAGQSNGFDEQTVGDFLAGSNTEIGQAVAWIDFHLRGPLTRWLAWHFPATQTDDLADVWSETIVDVLRAARSKRFHPKQTLIPWLKQIAWARAMDQVRLRIRRQRAFPRLLNSLAGTVHLVSGTSDPAINAEIQSLVRHTILGLPSRQRLVVGIYFVHYPESIHFHALHREVSLVTGQQESPVAVKRAFEKGRSKLQHALRLAGYGPEKP